MFKRRKLMSYALSFIIGAGLLNPLTAYAAALNTEENITEITEENTTTEDTINIYEEPSDNPADMVPDDTADTADNTDTADTTNTADAADNIDTADTTDTADNIDTADTTDIPDGNDKYAADNETDEFDIDELVANGEFDSESLTQEQIEYIYDLYNEDPMAIFELQKASDYNSGENISLYSTTYGSGYTHSSKFSSYDVKNGIDVSQWQGEIDWDKVKASGIDFAIIRVAYRAYGSGVLYQDSYYKQNLQGALDAGLDVGIYIFSQATSCTEAAQEANYAISLAKGYNYTLPVVMDFEYAAGNSGRLADANLSITQATTICNYFCYTVEKYNKVGMLYANKSLLTNDVNASGISSNYPIWLANYTTATSYSGDYSYWQYSSTGQVSGINGNVDMNFRYVKNPVAPSSLSYAASSTGTSISLNWGKVKEAYGYQIFRMNNSTGKYELIGAVVGTTNTSFKDTDVTADDVFKYTVRAVYKLANGNYYGNCAYAVIAPASQKQVKGLKAKVNSSSSISLSWTAQSGVAGYRILRYDKNTGKYVSAAVIKNSSTTTYTDTGLNAGIYYTYRIQAYDTAYDSVYYYTYSDAAVVCTQPGKVTGLKASAYTNNSITLTWNEQAGVNGYYIFRYNISTGKWNCIGQTKGSSSNTYKDTGLSYGCTYKYCVRAYYTASNGSTAYAACSDAYNACTATKAVSNLNIANCTLNTIDLTWGKAAGAHGYSVFIYNSSKGNYDLYKRIDDGNTLSCTISGLNAGQSYLILVRAWKQATNNTYYFGTAASITAKTRPGTLSDVKSAALNTRQILTWTADGISNGYYIYYYDTVKKTFSYVNTVLGQNNTSYSAPTLSSRYVYYVCGYVTNNGKNYRGTLTKAISSSRTLTATVTATSLNVRRGASTSYAIVGKVTYGQSVTITDSIVTSNKTWYKITFTSSGKTYTGYVSGAYLKVK